MSSVTSLPGLVQHRAPSSARCTCSRAGRCGPPRCRARSSGGRGPRGSGRPRPRCAGPPPARPGRSRSQLTPVRCMSFSLAPQTKSASASALWSAYTRHLQADRARRSRARCRWRPATRAALAMRSGLATPGQLLRLDRVQLVVAAHHAAPPRSPSAPSTISVLTQRAGSHLEEARQVLDGARAGRGHLRAASRAAPGAARAAAAPPRPRGSRRSRRRPRTRSRPRRSRRARGTPAMTSPPMAPESARTARKVQPGAGEDARVGVVHGAVAVLQRGLVERGRSRRPS